MDGLVSKNRGRLHWARALGARRAPAVDRLAALLREASRGDEGAFAELYDASSARLYGLAQRIVRDPAQSEDVAQQAFLEIWRTAAHFDDDSGSATEWILTIAHRTAVDRVRSLEGADRRDRNHHAAHLHLDEHTAADSARSSLEARRVVRALTTLDPAQRGALELAYFGGYTHAEVGTILGLPLGTTPATLRDGLGDLGRILERQP